MVLIIMYNLYVSFEVWIIVGVMVVKSCFIFIFIYYTLTHISQIQFLASDFLYILKSISYNV